ncbi:hypothetical protein F5884DRAFT_110262 [Xylogone sp. PMI_703]|nr:hypothetical protein F5884DRAFT_110262 [Xylogone sp. PMI_703]
MSFPFVIYDGGKLPRDRSVRRLMRQYAMKDVAVARRQRRDYGQYNLVQYPLFLEEGDQTEDLPLPEEAQHDNNTSSRHNADVAASDRGGFTAPKRRRHHSTVSYRHTNILPAPSASLGLALPEDFSLLLNLTPLTGLRLGIATSAHLTSDPAQTRDLFSVPHLGSRKLLSFIPSRYAQVASLRHATDCVIAKLRQIMQSPDSRVANGEVTALLHYSKALKALRAAIADETQRVTPETLCAVVLLGIFEVLGGNSEAHSWIRHINGATRLIEIRDAHRFNTEFEIALFMVHIGPTVMDALLSNSSCFLTEGRWQRVMRLAIYNDESLTGQKDLAFTLWSHLVRVPKYFKDTTDIVFSPYPVPQAIIDDITSRLWNGLDALLWWVSRAELQTSSQGETPEVCKDDLHLRWPTFESTTLNSRSVNHMALWGTYTMCIILKAHLLFALAPSRFHHLEVSCQKMSGDIISFRQHSTRDENGKHIWGLYMSQSSWIANGILDTKDIWSEGWEDRDGVIERWKFEAWCKSIGIRCSSVE